MVLNRLGTERERETKKVRKRERERFEKDGVWKGLCGVL